VAVGLGRAREVVTDLSKLGPWVIIIRCAQEALTKASPPAVDWSERVDGSPHDTRLDLLSDLSFLVRGIEAEDWIICRIAALGVVRDEDGDVVTALRNGEACPVGLNAHQVARAASRELARKLRPREVEAALSRAYGQVKANIRRRIEAQMVRVERPPNVISMAEWRRRNGGEE
jgi:hypothetical protein